MIKHPPTKAVGTRCEHKRNSQQNDVQHPTLQYLAYPSEFLSHSAHPVSQLKQPRDQTSAIRLPEKLKSREGHGRTVQVCMDDTDEKGA